MFDTPDAARTVLQGHFEPQVVEELVAALVPAIVLEPTDESAATRLGGTRLGGTPDLPPNLAWPHPPAPDDPEEIARRGNEDAAEEMRAHFAGKLPYAFFAQIDLREAAVLGAVAAPLPQEGRLLFFYDYAVGPWETGARVARVIWDRAPRETLVASVMPPDLTEAITREREAMAATFAKHGLDEPDRAASAYAAPFRAAVLTSVYRLPQPHSLEIAAVPKIDAKPYIEMSADEQRFYDEYQEFLEEHDGFDHDRWRRQQLLGSPMPEHDDPRYDAVAIADLGMQRVSPEEWQKRRADIEARARGWTLLLQVDLADLSQADFVEGTVYFVIRARDLAARRFDDVVAVYQQT